jgi:ABC-type uncharacterized transport system permease subunit
MSLRNHIRLGIIVTAVWVLFWLLGWPDYYQQYSTRSMVIFVVVLLALFWILVIRILRSIQSERIYKSIILSIYFTVPFFVYDYVYCGFYSGNGIGFLHKYWYLTIYYIIPWILVPLTAVWIERKAKHTDG